MQPSAGAADERSTNDKAIAEAWLVPVRLTVMAEVDSEAMPVQVTKRSCREIRGIRRPTREALTRGSVLVAGCADGGVRVTKR